MGRERHSLCSGSGMGRAMLCERTEPALLNTFTKCTANTESCTLACGMVVQNCFLIADFDHQLVFIFIFYLKNNQNNQKQNKECSLELLIQFYYRYD